MKCIYLSLLTTLVSISSFAGIGNITGDTLLCIGQTSQFSDTTPAGMWNSSDTLIASVNDSGVVTGIATGTAVITYAADDSVVTVTVSVNFLPSPVIGPAYVCLANNVFYFDTTGIRGSWSLANDITATMIIGSGILEPDTSYGSVIATAYGYDTVIYKDSVGCSVSMPFRVIGASTEITGNTTIRVDSVTALYDSIGGGTWSSLNTAVATVDATTGIVTGLSPGTTLIQFDYTQGCSADIIITVLRSLQIPVLMSKNNINIYPNPATTFLMIQTNNTASGAVDWQITVTNVLGQPVYTRTYSSPQVQIDVSFLPAGVYFVKVNGSEVRKFVKE